MYLVIVVVGTALAVFGGGLAAMLLVTPFAIALPLGMRRRTDAVIDVRVTLDTQRCLEGDTVRGRIDITGPPGTTIEVAIECPTTALTAPPDDPWAWHIAADVATPIGLPIDDRDRTAGDGSRLGHLLVRVIDHGSLLDRRASVMDLPDLMVLPIARDLDQLLPPAAAHAALGAHPARRRTGDGYDFAEIRAYQPGDRMRDLNWRATLRRGEPHVNRRHPERSGDVVIVLDAFPDSLRGQTEVGEDVILRAGRAAWAIAREHLDANDRVGFVAEGANPVWLPPGTGRRARYALLQALLDAFSTSTARATRDPAAPSLPDPASGARHRHQPARTRADDAHDDRAARRRAGRGGDGDRHHRLAHGGLARGARHGAAGRRPPHRPAHVRGTDRDVTAPGRARRRVAARRRPRASRPAARARPPQDAERGMTSVIVPAQTGELGATLADRHHRARPSSRPRSRSSPAVPGMVARA